MRQHWPEMNENPFRVDKKPNKVDPQEIEKFKKAKRDRARKKNLLEIIKKCEEHFETEINFNIDENTEINKYMAALAVVELSQEYNYSFEEISEFLGISKEKAVYLRHHLFLFKEGSNSLKKHLKKIDIW